MSYIKNIAPFTFLLAAFLGLLINVNKSEQTLAYAFVALLLMLPVLYIILKENNLFQRYSEFKDSELGAEELRKTDFPDQFGGLARTPVLSKVVRAIYAEGWFFVGALVVLVLIQLAFAFPYLNNFAAHDEYHTYSSAKSLMETGNFDMKAWNFLYDRPVYQMVGNKFVTINIAILFKIFGESILTAQAASLIFSIGFTIFSYVAVKNFFDKASALLFLYAFTTMPYYIRTSFYIESYIHLLCFSMVFYVLLIRIFRAPQFWKVALYSLVFLVLLRIAYDLRVFYYVFLAPFALVLFLRFYQLIMNRIQSPRIQNALHLTVGCAFLITLFLLTFQTGILAKFLSLPSVSSLMADFYLSNFMKKDIRFFWKPVKMLYLVLNPLLAFFLYLAFFIPAVRNFDKWKENKFIGNILLLMTFVAILSIVYAIFPAENRLTIRYLVPTLPLAIILVLGLLHFFVLHLVNYRKGLAFSLVMLFAILYSQKFWVNSTINGPFGNGYNFTDMYVADAATQPGRLKEFPRKMLISLNEEISKHPEVKKVNILMGDYVYEPRLDILKPNRDRIHMQCLRWFDMFFDMKAVDCVQADYDKGGRRSLTVENFQKVLENYSLIYAVFPTRKSYKYLKQIDMLRKANFTRIGGPGIDLNGIEVYRYLKK